MRHFLLVAVLLLGLATGITQANPLVIRDQQDVIPLGLHTEYLLDDSRALTLEQVQAGTFTAATTPALNFGFTRGRVWLRFQIDNPLPDAQTRILDVRYFLLDNVSLHVPIASGEYQIQRNGRFYLPDVTDRHGRFYSFSLHLPARSSQVFYLEVESGDSIALPIVLSTPAQQHRYQIRDTLFMTLYGGLILSTLLFALFMLASLRERELVYYVGFLVSHHVLAIMLMEGVPTALFGLDSLLVTRELVLPAISCAILMSVLFMRNFLRLRQHNLTLYRVSQWMAGAMAVTLVLMMILPHFVAVILNVLVCMVVGTGILACCVLQARTQREARHFLLAWTAGILGATFYGLKVFQLVPVNTFTSYSWHMGTVVEAILFSFTIAHRVNMERRERLRTQTELADRERALRVTQEQLLHAETAAKEELEARVRERTRDISRILSELEHENKVLVELSINDGLTRVRNRRFFNDIYPQLWQEALEQHQWFSIIMVDIDHFKGINDQHGHLMGDRCLLVIAGVIKQLVSRPTDVVCRYGGEEFIVLLPETDVESARWVAERIRKRISETLCELDDQAITVTASFGVAGMIPEPGLDPMKLISVCDEALYTSKQQGRNRVTLAGKPQAPSNVSPLLRRQ